MERNTGSVGSGPFSKESTSTGFAFETEKPSRPTRGHVTAVTKSGPRLLRMSQTTGTRRNLPGVLRHPSALLLLAQLFAVLAYPFLESSRGGAAVLGVISMVAVGLALRVVRNTPALTFIAVALGVPAVVMTLLEAFLPNEDWVILTSALLHAPFYLYVFCGTLRYVFHDNTVTTDELYAIGAAFPCWPGGSRSSTSRSRSCGRGRSSR